MNSFMYPLESFVADPAARMSLHLVAQRNASIHIGASVCSMLMNNTFNSP